MNKEAVVRAIEKIEREIEFLTIKAKYEPNKEKVQAIEYSIFRFTRAKNDLSEAILLF